MHWSSISEALTMGIAVLVFLSIYRKRHSSCTWNWIAAWVVIALHFVFAALTPDQPGPLNDLFNSLSVSALIVAGIFFFLATIETRESLRLQQILVAAVTLPAVAYVFALTYQPRTSLLVLLILAVNAGLLGVWFYFARHANYGATLLLAGAFACASAIYCALMGNPGYAVNVGLTGLYCVTALSYWRRFRRPSAGVIISVVSLLAWGAVFMTTCLIECFHPGLIPLGSRVWNIPKYFLAAAMILTLLEDEIMAARRLMQRYRLQFDRSPCAVYRSSTGGHLLECNDAFARIFDRSREEMMRTNLGELLNHGGLDAHELLGKLVDDAPSTGTEFAIVTPSGATRHLIGNAALVADSPLEPGEIQGMLLDITEFKALQEQIRDSQKLEALGLLAGGVAHDFNNLLMVIAGHMELLEMMVGEDAQAHATLEAVRSATQRGTAITGQLLAFSRKRPPETRLLDVNALLQEAHNLFRPVLGEKIELEVRSSGNFRLDVMADENQLILVLLNMIINARDAMASGGRIALEASIVEFDESMAKLHGLQLAGYYVCISVSDTGCGIPPEIKARVFDPFFTTKPLGKGTGLGLSICYGIIRQHRGTITIASSPGVGTTMRSYLPMVTTGVAATGSAIHSGPRASAGLRVLLVDDEDMLREPACAYLRQAGFDAAEASSSEQALEMFRRQPFDLVITDMVMPGMNGKQLGDELKKIAPALPIIYVSGYAQDILDRQGQLEKGAVLLQKPYSLKRLVRLALEELEKRGILGRASGNSSS